MKRRTRNAIALGVMAAAILFLTYNTFAGAAEYYYNVDQLATLPTAQTERFMQVHGTVAAGSVDWQPGVPELRFTLSWNGSSVPVVYRGVRPDVFKEGLQAVAAGHLVNGTLVATNVTVKCPSKYQAAQTQ